MNSLSLILLASALVQDPTVEIRRCLSEARKAAEAIPSAPANEPARYLVLSSIAQAYAEIGDMDPALQTAAALTLRPHRTQTLVHVARIRKKKGDVSGMNKSLQAAHDDALKGDPEFASSSLRDVAEAYVEFDPARALELCRKGVELANAEKLPQRKSLGIGGFAAIQAAAGDLESALATASTVPDAGYRKQAIVMIAQARARAGDATGTLRALEGLEEQMTLHPLMMLVVALARAGDIEGARPIREKVKVLSRGPLGEVAFCRGRVEAGDFKGALAAAASIESEPHRHDVRKIVAFAQLKANNLKGALETLAPVPLESRTPDLLQELARAQAEAKQPAEALKTARSIREPFPRAWALIRIAAAQDRTGALQTLDEARKTAETVPDHTGNRTTLLVHIDAARAALQAETKPSADPTAVREIAKARARAGEAAAARTWAAGLEAGVLRSSALLGVAEGLLDRK